ncbi:MAG: type IV pilin protein [Acidimicrobiales bacterium]
MLKKLNKRREDDNGFTLIELMVVVLIMGILMAIAIPTFLSTRGAAYDASAKSNATNAFTGEKAYYSDNLTFLDTTTTPKAATLDSSLPWATSATVTPGQVTAVAFSVGSGFTWAASAANIPDNGVLIMAEAKSTHDCFYIADAEDVGGSALIGYAESSGGCTAPSAANMPTSVNPTGNAGANIVTSGAPGAGNWYASW